MFPLEYISVCAVEHYTNKQTDGQTDTRNKVFSRNYYARQASNE